MVDDLMKTRQSLLLRLKRQEGEAWREFLAIYEEAIFRYCRGRGLQDADARDATQEVLAAVHDRVERWDCQASSGSLRAWLFRVARNVAVDALRRRGRQVTGSGDSGIGRLLSETSSSAEQDCSALHWEYRQAMFQWAAEQVKPEVRDSTWQAFWMTAVDGLPANEVADRLDVSIGTVYTAKCRVAARIRAKISNVDETEGEFPPG